MSFKDRLDNVFDVSKRYGYVVNKSLMRSAFVLMFLLFVVVGFVDGFSVAISGGQYVYCDNPLGCSNPFAEPVCDLFGNCESAMMVYGDSFGVKPSLFARVVPYLCVGLFVLALLLNHLIYNKNFRVKK